jgi:superfamily II DNA helicase RecQ
MPDNLRNGLSDIFVVRRLVTVFAFAALSTNTLRNSITQQLEFGEGSCSKIAINRFVISLDLLGAVTAIVSPRLLNQILEQKCDEAVIHAYKQCL